ncbi:cytochrome c3 family protein [Candidatus Amarolinea aalborgensis]|uniref:cytochrome c3 family protein n=1 Tax=Candidatus Amarolinea aalborgensis TaxID=2249329 RepID=UPI003BF9DBF3
MMKSNRLGCWSGTGIIAAALTVLLIGGISLAQGGVLFSPGRLNAQKATEPLGRVLSHADLARDCGACHTAPWSQVTMGDRCQVCHTTITEELGNPKTLHGALRAQKSVTPCQSCHKDHRGPTAALTILDNRDFPHDAVGYSLQGHATTAAGQPFACQDCHGEEITRFDVATCDACHRTADPPGMQLHTQAFGSDCLACHDGLDTYSQEAFDHNSVAFPLEGKHAPLSCDACHQGAGNLDQLKATPQTCAGCHRKDDKHQGQFGDDCAACHNPANWQDAKIDHNKTAFPLLGKHTTTKCEACHADKVYKGTPTSCVSCHLKDDKHQGQFGDDCAGCHTPEDWAKATFDHSKTAFALTGAHINTACTKCHTDNVFKGTPQACARCHADPAYHKGVFGADCQTCHATSAWSPARFNLRHVFPLDHGEGGVSACRACHPDSLKAYTCYGCHEHTPTGIQAKHVEEGIRDFQDCVRCHADGRKEAGD